MNFADSSLTVKAIFTALSSALSLSVYTDIRLYVRCMKNSELYYSLKHDLIWIQTTAGIRGIRYLWSRPEIFYFEAQSQSPPKNNIDMNSSKVDSFHGQIQFVLNPFLVHVQIYTKICWSVSKNAKNIWITALSLLYSNIYGCMKQRKNVGIFSVGY